MLDSNRTHQLSPVTTPARHETDTTDVVDRCRIDWCRQPSEHSVSRHDPHLGVDSENHICRNGHMWDIRWQAESWNRG